MISRREAMGASLFATLGGPAAGDSAQSRESDAEAVRALKDIKGELESVSNAVEGGLVGPGLAAGVISRIRDRYTIHMKAAGKFPEFMEIGLGVFYDVYDWHVRYNQQIQITRVAEQRFAIQFMFTQL
ncbi:MAG TPA: hypothetical protein VJ691_16630, partial [Vicinamibacterales bacterium]|nr:hypothetical protein [Vicinamibacterales bacterium]